MDQPVVAGAPTPSLEFVFRIKVGVGAPIDHGDYEGRRRRVLPITGGMVEGPGFQGVMLPLGADWQNIRISDGTTLIEGATVSGMRTARSSP